jgi:deferrochelatase/peroxidase EfeB
LRIVDNELPHRQQEGLETVVALVAVAMVTYMIVWMTEHARDLKGQLQDQAAGALAQGSAMALVAMAFLAVLREGFETSVFLLAAFNDATDPVAAGLGVVLGLVRRRRARLRDLPRRPAPESLALLPRHGRRARPGGRRPRRLVAAHGRGGRLGRRRPSAGAGPERRHPPWHGLGVTHHRHPRDHPQPTVIEVVGWLLYAIQCWPSSSPPTRCARAVRATVAGVAVVAAPIVLLVGTLGGDKETSAAVASAGGAGKTVNVAITNAGCEPATLKLGSGPTTFVVTNKGSSKATEYEVIQRSRTLAEVENVADGLTRRFSLTLQPGRYTLRCTGADHENASLTVSGARANAALAPDLQRGVDAYRAFLERQTAALVGGVQSLRSALGRGDLAAARRAYAVARVPYERVEPVAESFGDLDPRIDARANDVPKSKWTGFHPIERRLWVQKTTEGTAKLADGLVTDSRELQRLVRTVKLEPAQVGNGANELLGEVSKSKITGEEERYSHIDLLDFQANVEGARAAFDAIRPALAGRDPALVTEIERRFGLVDAALRPHARGDGFVPYTELRKPQVRRLSVVIDALAEAAVAGAREGALRVAMALTRRALLASFGVGGLAAAAGGGYAPRPRGRVRCRRSRRARADRRLPRSPPGGHHPRPPRIALHFAALDVEDGVRASDLRELLRTWSGAAERMTAGRPVGDANGEALAPPQDTGEAFGLTPAHLSVTFGLGPSLFDGRFGLSDHRPQPLRTLPALPGDELDPARSNGDLCIQACADDPQVAFHAVRNLARIGRGAVTVRWSQLGFGRTASTSTAQATPRNLLGFKDGTANLKAEDPDALARHVWVAGDRPSEPAWLRDGTYLVARRIRMLIEVWDRTSLGDQEQTIGRHKVTGAPLGERDEFATLKVDRPCRPTATCAWPPPRPTAAPSCCAAATRSQTASTTASASSTPACSSSPSSATPTRSCASSASSLRRPPQRVHQARRLGRVGGPAGGAEGGLRRADAARGDRPPMTSVEPRAPTRTPGGSARRSAGGPLCRAGSRSPCPGWRTEEAAAPAEPPKLGESMVGPVVP